MRDQGRSHAVALAREGVDIVACDILEQISTVAYPLATQEDMGETERLVTEAGGRFVGVKADMRDAAAANTVVEQALGEFGKVGFSAGQRRHLHHECHGDHVRPDIR